VKRASHIKIVFAVFFVHRLAEIRHNGRFRVKVSAAMQPKKPHDREFIQKFLIIIRLRKLAG